MSNREILAIHRPKYWLRWRFDYADGKPSKYGGWLNPGDEKSPNLLAYRQSKVGLGYARIDVKNIETNCTAPIVECPAEDFVNFEWLARASSPLLLKGEIKLGGSMYGTGLVGLILVTRYEKIQVTIDGQVKRIPRTDADRNNDKLFHYGR